jgi:hypothetical protein
MFTIWKPPGYVPSPRELRLARFAVSTYRAKHRHGIRLFLRRQLRRFVAGLLADVLAAAKAIDRAVKSIRASRPMRRPVLTPEPPTPQEIVVSMLRRPQGAHRAHGVMRRAVRHATRMAGVGSRESVPSRDTGTHRLDRLCRLDNEQYLAAMRTRIAYVTGALAQLRMFSGNEHRARGEMTWRERARNADRYAAA